MGSAPARTFDDVLRDIRDKSTSPKDLGDRFERIILDVLTHDRHYKNRFDRVQLWKDWARENGIKDAVGTGQDLGIDIVARERVGGDLCAVQCKCYSDDTVLGTAPVNSFLAAERSKMKNHILACTGPINNLALAKLRGAHCQIITQDDLRYRFDWESYPKKIVPPPPKKLMPYQKKALGDVVSGFAERNRGKLIMACGTGKTLVSLHVAEKLVGKGGAVLYLVPSISLILQSMREWSDNANMPHYYMAVCSDTTVRNTEQGTLTELEAPASTDPKALKERVELMRKDSLNVIFSTYHSIEVVEKAMAGRKLNLVLCDEAHRTAGVDERGSESYYTRVHYDKNISAARRLYMTATPRLYTDAVRGKAEQQEKVVVSMDDNELYGPKFHELSFYDAVHKHKVLCDFKVRVAVMDGNTLSELVQENQASDSGMVPLGEKALMASVWHALEHPGADDKKGLLQRAIMFCDMINSSKIVAGDRITYKKDIREDSEELEKTIQRDTQRSFKKIVSYIKKVTKDKGHNNVIVKHVDGGDSAQERRARLDWLKKSDDDPDTCRILSNARCLSEGVDVPALDGVVFMNPRKSVVDVVQAVGRVMRKSPGKEFGYVILPVAIPARVDIDDAMERNEYFKVVWQVLNALRSHDPQLASEINRLVLTDSHSDNEVTNRIIIRHAYGHGLRQTELLEPKIISGIASKLVQKVGDVNYYDKYGKDLGKAARTIESLIQNKMEIPDQRTEVERLRIGLRQMVGDSVTFDETIRILAQHMVLARVFDLLFSGEFTPHNPIAQIFESVAAKIGLQEELHKLGNFYEEIEREISIIETREARQNFIKKIYGNFLESADKKGAKKHGVVYTPVEVVDFIVRSVDVLLQNNFDLNFNDRAVKVIDPFAGTGTFLTRLLESGLIVDNMYEKYRHDLFANELVLLAYYIATINIETTYSSLRKGGRYVPFGGISYTDTLRIPPRYRESAEHRQVQSKIDDRFKAVHDRIRLQRGSHIHVILGNPPYSAGQKKSNDKNQNISYPDLDERISNTYVRETKTINPYIGSLNRLYDSYIRSIRWASDRIGESGIIGFVTNAGFVRSKAGAGIRACIAREFNEVWCFDLRGDALSKGEQRKREGDGIFGAGSKAPVAVTFLVKNPQKNNCVIHYKDIGDYLTRDVKLKMISSFRSINLISDWKIIKPDKHYSWLDQRGDVGEKFASYRAIGDKKTKSGGHEPSIFKLYSRGVATSRDRWAYNSSKKELSINMQLHIDYANSQEDPLNPEIDPQKAVFTIGLKQKLKKIKSLFDDHKIRRALYRPFFKQYLYFDPTGAYTERVYRTPVIFPYNDSKNLLICITDSFKGEFSVLITNTLPDLHILAASQCFPLYVYTSTDKIDNIMDSTLVEYQQHYHNSNITKKDIFYYVYGILHHEEYGNKFRNSLRQVLPRIPMAPDFARFCNAGRTLADLHLNFEDCNRYELGPPKIHPPSTHFKFSKLSFGTRYSTDAGKMVKDTSVLRADGAVLFDNIPEMSYMVDGRTPLEWVVDRYKITVDKDSGIVNDPCTGTDIIAVIERAVYIGIESERIIKSLPDEFEPGEDWKPKEGGLGEFS